MRGTDEKGSQSTIKMEKGYYGMYPLGVSRNQTVAIHNKNGQGLLQDDLAIRLAMKEVVAIHNKNGKGLLHFSDNFNGLLVPASQSTIKMEKGYYENASAGVS